MARSGRSGPYDAGVLRRLVAPVLLLAFAAVALYQARSAETGSDFEWVAYTGPPEKVVTTPLLSLRRAPEWLVADVTDRGLSSAVAGVASVPSAPDRTCVVAYRGDELVAETLGDEPMVPASLNKLITAAVILELAGPDATYVTEVFISNEARDSIADGVLDGDLYLVGDGDPVLSTPGYIGRWDEPRAHTDITALAEQVAAELTRLGVNDIRGGVVADESHYPEEERDYTREWPGAVFDDASADDADTDEDAAEDSDAAEGAAPEDGADPIWKPSFVSENQAGPLSALLVNDGYAAYPDEPNRRANVRAGDPARQAVELFDDLLEARDFRIRSRTSKGTAPEVPDQRTSLGRVESPPLSEIVTRMLTYSDNTIAEMLLKEIGIRSGLDSSRKSAVFGAYGMLQEFGLSLETVVIADGSGLSSYNRLTCDLIAEVLRRAGPDSALADGLAVVGESGTLSGCLSRNPAVAGRVKAKTGTLNDVTALAGITETSVGDVITFAVIANGPAAGTLGLCNELQRAIITATTGHPYGPNADEVAPAPARTPPQPEAVGPDPAGPDPAE